MISLELHNNRITVGEILDYPPAQAVFRRRFGKWANHPLVATSRSLTLAQLIQMAGAVLPQKTIQETLAELERV